MASEVGVMWSFPGAWKYTGFCHMMQEKQKAGKHPIKKAPRPTFYALGSYFLFKVPGDVNMLSLHLDKIIAEQRSHRHKRETVISSPKHCIWTIFK